MSVPELPVSAAPPVDTRPGRPEGVRALVVLAHFGVLFALGTLGWALLLGSIWLAWIARVYVLLAAAVLLASGVVTLCLWLAVKGNARARGLAAGIFVGLVLFVSRVVQL